VGPRSATGVLSVCHAKCIAQSERWYDKYRQQRHDEVILEQYWVKPVCKNSEIAVFDISRGDGFPPKNTNKDRWYHKYEAVERCHQIGIPPGYVPFFRYVLIHAILVSLFNPLSRHRLGSGTARPE